MKTTWWAAVAATLVIISAYAFVGDKMTKTIGDLGLELVRAVSLAGEIQTDIARPSADDLIKNKNRIQRRLGDLKEGTEAISQLLLRMRERPSLSMENLDAAKRADFLRLVPADLRPDVEKRNAIDLAMVLQIYARIKNDVQRDASFFDKALSEITESSNIASINKVGTTRGALTASLGRLVEFSGRIQELAYLQEIKS
jgi:hypothetical protein